MTLDEIVELTKQLSLLDKVRLIEEIAPQIEQELKAAQPTQRKAGLHTGAIWTSGDFDEPLSDEFWTGTS
jgi:hypothetical protein